MKKLWETVSRGRLQDLLNPHSFLTRHACANPPTLSDAKLRVPGSWVQGFGMETSRVEALGLRDLDVPCCC